MLEDFTCSWVTQYGLFDDTPPHPHSERLMQLLDSLNRRGRTIWFRGQEIPERRETCKMQRKWLLPAYTKRLQDIPVVKAWFLYVYVTIPIKFVSDLIIYFFAKKHLIYH